MVGLASLRVVGFLTRGVATFFAMAAGGALRMPVLTECMPAMMCSPSGQCAGDAAIGLDSAASSLRVCVGTRKRPAKSGPGRNWAVGIQYGHAGARGPVTLRPANHALIQADFSRPCI